MKNKFFISFLIILLFSLKVIPQIKYNISKKENLKNVIKKSENRISILKEQIKKYEIFIKKLETDFEQEKIARNKLKMIKKNENIYKLIEKEEGDKEQ